MYFGQHYNVAPFGSSEYNVYLKDVGNSFVSRLSHDKVAWHFGKMNVGLRHVHDFAVHKFGIPSTQGAMLGNSAGYLAQTGNNALSKLSNRRLF